MIGALMIGALMIRALMIGRGQGASKAKGLAVFGIAYKPLVGASGGPFDGAAAV
jgi:hypothetical protein